MAEAVGLAMEEKSGAGSGEKLGLEPSVWSTVVAAAGGHGNLPWGEPPALFVLPILCKFQVCQLYLGII